MSDTTAARKAELRPGYFFHTRLGAKRPDFSSFLFYLKISHYQSNQLFTQMDETKAKILI
jgi:hypothetical protein